MTIDIDTQVAKAEAAAEKARQKAQQLRDQQAAAEHQATAETEERRARFDARAADRFDTVYRQALVDAQAAFNTAVATGEGVFTAWAHVQRAAAQAAAETNRLTWATHKRATAAYEDLADQVTRWNARLEQARHALTRNAEPLPARNYNPPVALMAPHRDQPTPTPAPDIIADVEQINTEINNALEEHGRTVRRQLDDTSHVSTTGTFDITRPSLNLTRTKPEAWESRSITQALTDAYAQVREQATADHKAQVAAAFAEFE